MSGGRCSILHRPARTLFADPLRRRPFGWLRDLPVWWISMAIRVFERADFATEPAERCREAHSNGDRRHVQFCTDRTACACYCESASQAGPP